MSKENVWKRYGDFKINTRDNSLHVENKEAEFLEINGRDFTEKVEEIIVVGCPRLQSISFVNLEEVKVLQIGKCPNMENLGDIPKSIKELYLKDFNSLKKTPRNDSRLSDLKKEGCEIELPESWTKTKKVTLVLDDSEGDTVESYPYKAGSAVAAATNSVLEPSAEKRGFLGSAISFMRSSRVHPAAVPAPAPTEPSSVEREVSARSRISPETPATSVVKPEGSETNQTNQSKGR